MIDSVIPFAGGSCHVETSQLIYSKNHFTGFCMLWGSTERYFWMDDCLFQLIWAIIDANSK